MKTDICAVRKFSRTHLAILCIRSPKILPPPLFLKADMTNFPQSGATVEIWPEPLSLFAYGESDPDKVENSKNGRNED